MPAPSTPPRVADETILFRTNLGPTVSPWDLPPDLYAHWEERVCIMHFDAKIPWLQAEALALAEVTCLAGPVAERDANAGPKVEPAEKPAAAVQADLFAGNGNAGPYVRGY